MRRRRTISGFNRGPNAIDPASGFKVPLEGLRRQWDGELVDRHFIDKRNPLDFIRSRPERQNLPYSRPEAPDVFLASNILLEDYRPLTQNDGRPAITHGPTVQLTVDGPIFVGG